jgi:hypothetical protein
MADAGDPAPEPSPRKKLFQEQSMRCETVDQLPDGRIVSPSAERNKGPIAGILMRVLPTQGDVLGIRNVEDVALLAASEGLELHETHDMPANNLSVIFRKR